MREFVITMLAVIGIAATGGFVVSKCVEVANAKETTTLEDALERPVKIKKHVDKANNVVCYWQEGSKYMTCLQRRGLPHHNGDVR